MNFITLIAVAILGIMLAITVSSKTVRSNILRCFRGTYLANRNAGAVSGQSREKAENKTKILEFMRENPNQSETDGQVKKVANNDIEKLLGVSDATATRYMNELEKEQKVRQIGKTGNAVYYLPVK